MGAKSLDSGRPGSSHLQCHDGLLPRGRLACKINGYEIQVTELLYSGVLDQMDMHQLAATFTALIYEERRRDAAPGSEKNVLRSLSGEIEKSINRFVNLELRAGFEHPIKQPSFTICAAADAWSRGASVEKVEYLAGQDGGDFVRTMRMAVQMMRQLRLAVGRDYALYDRLAEAGVSINRDVVDAKRQFELG